MLKQVQNHYVNRLWWDAADLDVQRCFWNLTLAVLKVLKNLSEKTRPGILKKYMSAIGNFPNLENCCTLGSLSDCPFSMHTLRFAYHGIRNVRFSENFAYVQNWWPLRNHSFNACGKPLEKLIYLSRQLHVQS